MKESPIFVKTFDLLKRVKIRGITTLLQVRAALQERCPAPPARQISQQGDGVAAQAIFSVKADAVLGKTILYNSPPGSDPYGSHVPVEGQDGAVSAIFSPCVTSDTFLIKSRPGKEASLVSLLEFRYKD